MAKPLMVPLGEVIGFLHQWHRGGINQLDWAAKELDTYFRCGERMGEFGEDYDQSKNYAPGVDPGELLMGGE